MISWTKAVVIASTVTGAACATPGTRPYDMSAAQHEQRAALAEAEAAEHSARYDPARRTSRVVCARFGCSSQETNPTAVYREHADRLHAEAAEHRKAAEALHDAEANVCAATGGDQDLTPMFRRDEVERIEPIYRYTGGRSRGVEGAILVLARTTDVTADALQKKLDCHLARNAAVGFDAPDMGYCPLASRGVRAVVREGGGRLRIEITANDGRTAEEVLRRAQLLARR